MVDFRHSLNSPTIESIGFIPTMGALHAGHLSLVEESFKNKNENVIVSIFVNPLQFSKGEDLDKYPRQLNSDIKLLESVGVKLIFVPQEIDMYPNYSLCQVEPKDFSNIYEGQARPDFFRGVATIVCKLFNIVRPTDSYFGQKDISQCILIKKMVEDLNINGRIHICKTMRESDGLAMSSRNAYLSPVERSASNILYQALSDGKSACESINSILPRDVVIDVVNSILKSNPLVTKVEYISLACSTNMKELSHYDINSETGAVLSSAIRIGNVRLIDNLLIGNANKIIFGN